MTKDYMDAMYLDWIKGRPDEEVVDLIHFLLDFMQKKGYTLIGHIEITKED